MTTIGEADRLYLGSDLADAAYVGAVKVWPSGLVVSDDFNRANAVVSAGNPAWSRWSGSSVGFPAVISNRVVGEFGSTCGAIWTGDTFGNDQASQLTSMNISSTGWVGVTVRDQAAGQTNYLAIYYNNSGTPLVMLFKRVSGSFTQLGSTYTIPGGMGALSASDVLRLEAVGSAISAKLNGSVVVSATDTAVASGGAPGFAFFNAMSADNWEGSQL